MTALSTNRLFVIDQIISLSRRTFKLMPSLNNLNKPNLVSPPPQQSATTSMNVWCVRDFGSPLVKQTMSIPEINNTDQVLIKVKASSVNPLDTEMVNGYGRRLLSVVKQLESCSTNAQSMLPLIAGRDCSGVVEYKGQQVTKFDIGDEVMGIVAPTWTGAHAEYVLSKESWCIKKPNNISHVQAAALPYVACTVWAALVSIARVNAQNAYTQNVLIHGGSGGVGTFAIQLLKAWNVDKVVVTCSKQDFELVSSLGAKPVDYDCMSVKEMLQSEGPFDVILDCVNTELAQWSDSLMGIWRNSVHVTLLTPVLQDTDRYGIPYGLASTTVKYFARSFDSLRNGRWFSYAYFAPNEECLNTVSKLVESGKIKPIVEKTYSFNDIPEAYEKVARRHGKGKTVIDFEKN